MEEFTLSQGLTGEEVNRRLSMMNVDKTPVTMELLWENASPDSEFGPQTIVLDLSEYESVMIVTMYGTSQYAMSSLVVDVGKNALLNFVYLYSSSPYYVMGNRPVLVKTTGVEFKDNSNLQSSYGTFNTRNIPYKIYGIKGAV